MTDKRYICFLSPSRLFQQDFKDVIRTRDGTCIYHIYIFKSFKSLICILVACADVYLGLQIHTWCVIGVFRALLPLEQAKVTGKTSTCPEHFFTENFKTSPAMTLRAQGFEETLVHFHLLKSLLDCPACL